MSAQMCSRCGASLTHEGSCEYCGWNSSEVIPNKALYLSGILCNLAVTKETSTFSQKIGTPFVIENRHISQISILQAPIVGSGELSINTVTGFTQKITFLYPQNAAVNDILSYLLHVAPNAQFVNASSTDSLSNHNGVACPKCRSNNTITNGLFRKVSIWKIIVGILVAFMAISVNAQGGWNANQFIFGLLLAVGGIALALNGLGIFGKKKLNFLCMNCRKKFRV